MKELGRAPAGRRRRFLLPAAALLAGAASLFGGSAALLAQAQRPVLRIYRFWRAPDLTLVEVFGVIPLELLSFQPLDGRDRAAYRASFEVSDSSGLVLLRREWRNAVEIPSLTVASRQRATTSEHVQFQLKPGHYEIGLELEDSANGRRWSASAAVEASSSPLPASDLVVASTVERLEQGAPEPAGAIRRGTLAVVPNFSGALVPESGPVALFAEVYRPGERPDTARITVVVEGVGRAFRQELPSLTRVFPPGGGVETLRANLSGLPVGVYQLTVRAAFAQDTLQLTHPVEMLPAGAGRMALEAPTPYDGLAEAQLDSIFEPLRYVATPNEQDAYWSLPDADAKRRFLAAFWEERAVRMGTSPDSLRLEFEERVGYANRQFRPPRPGQKGVMGWQTDRGRVYITYGPPAERYVEAQRQAQRSNPWEVWKYITGRGDKYVFLDRTGFGDFQLVYSTNRDEPGLPDWERLFTSEALRFIRQF